MDASIDLTPTMIDEPINEPPMPSTIDTQMPQQQPLLTESTSELNAAGLLQASSSIDAPMEVAPSSEHSATTTSNKDNPEKTIDQTTIEPKEATVSSTSESANDRSTAVGEPAQAPASAAPALPPPPQPRSTSPIIEVHSGPPPKRNVAMKNTSAGFFNRAITGPNSFNKNREAKKTKDDSDSDDGRDEHLPKSARADSDDESGGSQSNDEWGAVSSGKRRSQRTTKKPKILAEFVTDSDMVKSPVNSASSATNIESQPKSMKSTARKSTSAMSRPASNFSLSSHSSLVNSHNSTNTINQRVAAPTASSTTSGSSRTARQPPAVFNGRPSNTNSLTNNTNTTGTSHEQQQQQQTTNVSKTTQSRHKGTMCAPKQETRSTQSKPCMRDQSTQLNNEDVEELMRMSTRMQIIPVPVPVHVPVPMFMYQAPLPVPIIIPVPVPVPVIIPTTKKTYDRVHRRIRKLRKKLPSDPNEFELLLYAEKLAREEGIPGFEESSDGESDIESASATTTTTNGHKSHKSHKHNNNLDGVEHKPPAVIGLDQATEQFISQDDTITAQLLEHQKADVVGMDVGDGHHVGLQITDTVSFKWNIGVKVFNTWLHARMPSNPASRLPTDMLRLTNDELNILLAEFVNEVRKPNGESYAPESIYYICLGIQHYLQEASHRGVIDNIFLDGSFESFQASLNRIAEQYKVRLDEHGLVTSRIEEEILWETRQLGVHSPGVLLFTVMYFNTKCFFLGKREQHKKLSFANVRKHVKKNVGPNGEDYGRSTFLRYYPEVQGHEQIIYEQCENYENPLRCPVELYNFYLSKCPESVKSRSDVFYLMPEKASSPTSPIWFSSQPVSDAMLERMLNRIKMVKEVNDWLMASTPIQ